MITKTAAYQTSDGTAHLTIEAAQKHELITLISDKTVPANNAEIAEWLQANSAKLIDILTTKPSSKAKARSINGGTKTRKKKDAATDPQKTLV